MKTPVLDLILCGGAGILLGAAFFGGLWLTVRRLPDSPAPALLALGSLLLRMTVLLAGLFLLMQGSWERLLAALAGILAARFILTRWISQTSPAIPHEKRIRS